MLKYVRVGCDVPESVRIAFDVKATENGMTMSDVLRVAIEAFLQGDTVDLGDTIDMSILACAYDERVLHLKQLAEESATIARAKGEER